MPKYKIPDAQKDIEYAVKFVKLNAHRWNVNQEKLGIVGHSSGGHLALLHAATAKKGNENSKELLDKVNAKIQAVACFYPPTDFLSFGANGINALANPRFQKFLPAFTDNIKDTITIAKIAEEVSPIKYVTSDMPPTLIISGTGDKLVPFMQSQLLIDKLNQLGVPCKLEVREGKDHGWPDIADDYRYVAEWFEKFLK
jgi:acetyl esterase/lipase